MKTNRIKPHPPTEAEMDAALSEVRSCHIRRLKLAAELARKRQALDDDYGPLIKQLGTQINTASTIVERWADANPSHFAKAKSLELTHGTIGWRTATPALKTLKGWDWPRVLDSLDTDLSMRSFIRLKKEVDKEAIISARAVLGPDKLALFGLKIHQPETFYITPKIETP